MGVASSGSGTYAAILRGVPVDPGLNAEFADLLFLLALAGRASMAALTIADEDMISIVAAHGVPRRTWRRANSLCDLTLASGKMVVIPDVLADPRVAEPQRIATEAGIRFYAGVSVPDSASRPVGTLYVADGEPRTPEPVFTDALQRTAARISSRLRQRAQEARAGRLQAERDSAVQKLDLHQVVIANMAEGVVVLSAADCRIHYANPTFETIFGYSSGELNGRPASVLNSPRAERAPETVAADISGRLRSAGWAAGEILNTRKDGTDFWTRYRVASHRHPVLGELWIFVQEDITERRKSEESLREAEALLAQAKRMQAIGRLAGGISHEFNNVLTTVIGHSELALPQLPPDSEVRERIEVIRDSAQRAAALTQHLLAFSGKQVLRPRTVNLASVLSKLEPRLARSAGSGIAVEVAPSAGEVWARADPQQLEMTFLSLAAAARERMPAGGRLVVEVAPDAGGGRVPAGRWARIVARDSGPAPDADHLARIFEPFSDPASLRPSSGLAFAVAYGFVTQSGGHALAAPSAAGGLEIRMFLPGSDGPDPAQRPTSSFGSLMGSGTILVVEDEAPVRGLVRQVLTSHGYEVLEAATGEEALRILATPGHSFALVLSDIVMPGISGRELARRLRRDHPALPVLLMSGFDAAANLSGDREAGAIPVLSKPFRPKDLARAVKEATKSKPGDARG